MFQCENEMTHPNKAVSSTCYETVTNEMLHISRFRHFMDPRKHFWFGCLKGWIEIALTRNRKPFSTRQSRPHDTTN